MSGITPKPYYFLGFVIPLSVIMGNYVGGFYVASGAFLGLVVFPLLDILLGDGRDSNPEDASPFFFDGVLYMHVLFQFIAIASLITGIKQFVTDFNAIYSSI